MKKVCVVTTTRADYGLLKKLIMLINSDEKLSLCLMVTGTHLLTEFGMTINEILEDSLFIDEKIDIIMGGDSATAISKTMGIALLGFADAFRRHRPDMLVVLGDRYELIPICSAAINYHIPIAHISGGEVTKGAIDDIIRHCVTKMSYLHFPGCETYRKRIIQLGEAPERVFNFGDPGVEAIRDSDLLSKKELEKSLSFALDMPYMVVTYHPVTQEESAVDEIRELLKAMSKRPNLKYIITKSNADFGGRTINQMIDLFAASNPNLCKTFESLGSKRYLSSMCYSAGVLGNSSSGIVEAPCFGIPTINIGERQSGRLQAKSIINCNLEENEIANAIDIVLTPEFVNKAKQAINPYGSGETSKNIFEVIKDYLYNEKINLKKGFYDIPFEVIN